MKPLRIHQLSLAVANQIAAGEVIERPASVVKELLENALDAGADSITIDIGFGGLNQVKVSDNGAGIAAEDLHLAIAPHATSKIRQLNDLYAIHSMGFRGEALASIAAVSRLSLSSKPQDQEHAMMLRFDGVNASLSPCARGQGTTVEVLDLFYNVPVRKKFLKTARSEYQAIEMVVKRFALGSPTIALTLTHNGKQVLALPAATSEKSRLLRIKKIVGKLFIEQAVYLDVEQGGMHLTGWISGRAYQRSQNDKQCVYINQRMVRDKLINHAIKKAYDDILHPGRYPACVLYFTLPAESVDVNVHPTKHEVRFQQPRLVHDFITTQLSSALKHPMPALEFTSSQPLMPECSSHVRETYIKQPLGSSTREKQTPANWCVLDTHFVILFIEEHPYLVDVERAQQQRLLAILSQQSFPLTERPLLVPVIHTLAQTECELFAHYQPELAKLGIQVDWLSNTRIVIRTLPQLLPQLDIKIFFQRLLGSVDNSSSDAKPELLKLLVNCQSFDPHQLTQDETFLLIDFLQQHVLSSGSSVLWCLRLDSEKCREILYV